jgi:hypothetical protein
LRDAPEAKFWLGSTNTDHEFQKAGVGRWAADTTSIGAARVFSPDIGGDYSHRAYRRTGQIGVIRNLTIDTFTLTAQALTQSFQLANDAVDLIHQGARHTLDQRFSLTSLVSLRTAGEPSWSPFPGSLTHGDRYTIGPFSELAALTAQPQTRDFVGRTDAVVLHVALWEFPLRNPIRGGKLAIVVFFDKTQIV